MRLSQYVHENGIDAFNADDFRFVGSKLATKPDRLILVGGQAIETWGLYFGVLPPTGEYAPLTEDADFLGSKEDAKWLCSLLGKRDTELIINKDIFGPSPNTAIAFIRRPDGRVLLMDFLRTVVGLSETEIKALAVRVDVGGVPISVLHPLLCLESRLANLEQLPTKRNTNGVMQAQWAVNIAEKYLLRMRSDGASDRDMIKACSRIAEAAEYRSGPYCFQNFEIDPLKAVSSEVLDAIGGRFVSDDWWRRVERIEKKRERGKRILSYRLSLTGQTPAVPVTTGEQGSGLEADGPTTQD